MDPVTHTLAGAALARTRLGRLGGLPARLAGAVLIAGANLPDVDVAAYFVSGDFALEHRRGWTHGLLAMVVLPPLLAGLALAWDRGRRRRRRSPGAGAGPPARFGPLLVLAAVAVWSHPLLDWLNTYGVRFLAPFDWTWFYGDAVFIVDPWLWLVLGGAVVLGRWVAPARAAAAGLAVAALYAGALVVSSAAGRVLVVDALERGEGRSVPDLMAGPEPLDPFHRQVVAETPDGYRVGRLSWLEGPRVEMEPTPAPRITPWREPPPAVRAALAAPGVRGFVTWMRFPTFEVERTAAGTVVHLIDLRYARRPDSGFGTARVHLSRDLELVDSRRIGSGRPSPPARGERDRG